MRTISLFAGCGGIDLALERAGCDVVLQAEKDPQALSVLRKHWPEVRKVDDVHAVRPRRRERIDLIAGGFPCQDLSVAGKRAGLAGNRSGLWWEFHRIIGEFAPAWVLAENVPGLLSSNGGRDMLAVLDSLGELGYGWAYRVLDAQFDAVPQRRERVFIVGCAGGRADRAAEVLFESDRLPWHPAPSREAGARVAPTIAARVNGGGGLGTDFDCDGGLVTSYNADDYANGTFEESECARPITTTPDRSRAAPIIAHSLRGEGFDASEDGTGRGTPLVPVAFTSNQDGDGRDLGDKAAFLKAQSGAGRGTYVSGRGVRKVTPRECERCMGMPDDFTRYGILEDGREVKLSDSARYRLIGNSVAVPTVEWIGRRIMAATAADTEIER